MIGEYRYHRQFGKYHLDKSVIYMGSTADLNHELAINRVRNMRANLSAAEERISEYILQNAMQETFLSISDLAFKAGVSEATIVRFCKKLGYSGFLEFKKAFLRERLQDYSAPPPYEEITPSDSSSVVLKKIFTLMQESLGNSWEKIDTAAFGQAVERLAMADMLEMYAHGGSGYIAQNVVMTYQRLGIRCVAITDPFLHNVAIEKTSLRDVVLGISHTGATESVVKAMQRARERGIPTVGVTNYSDSPLAQNVDLLLLTSISSPVIMSDAGVSRVAQLALLDAIGVAVMQKRRIDGQSGESL